MFLGGGEEDGTNKEVMRDNHLEQHGEIGEAENAQVGQNISVVGGEGQKRCRSGYLTTKEAADYLRKSVSWVVKRHDIPYVKGTPNIYKQKDLDDWFERNKFNPVRI